MKDQSKYGEWAIIAGASEGLGASFARSLAAKKFSIVLVARSVEKLKKQAELINKEYQVEVKIVAADLGTPVGLQNVLDSTKDIDIGLLVYNAAYSVIQPFLSQKLSDHLLTLEVNCTSLTRLVYHFGEIMKKNKRGGLLLMSSMSANQGSPLIATYAASKAYIRILGESLWYEFREHGIDVLVCSAGATATPNFIKSDPKPQSKLAPPVMEPQAVVDEALKELGKTPHLIPGSANRLANSFMNVFMSKKKAVNVMGDTMYKMYPEKSGKKDHSQ